MLDMTRHFTEIGITTLSMTTLLIAGGGYLVCASPNRLGVGTFFAVGANETDTKFLAGRNEKSHSPHFVHACTPTRLHAGS